MTGRPSGRCAARDLLAEARPFVLGALAAIETAQPLLEAIDAALASPCCVSADQERVKEALETAYRHGSISMSAEDSARVLAALALLGSRNEEEER